MPDAVLKVFRQALAVSGKGMLALFAFMIVFFLLLVLVDRLFPAGSGARRE